MSFSPIAIVGQGVVLPGALSPEALWQAVVSNTDLVSDAPDDRWGIAPERILTSDPSASTDKTWTQRGGYVTGFERVFNPNGFKVSAELIRSLDPAFQWALHAGREALKGAKVPQERTGAIFGNLSFPSGSLSAFAQNHWITQSPLGPGDAANAAGLSPVHPYNRFHSGLPAHLLAEALGLGGRAFTLDAACASSLYAIDLACRALHRGEVDAMLAGAVNRCDDLFIHVGFSALNALSKSGRSRPFHSEADGLIPGEGAGFVLLKRLADAEAAGDTVLGVIRGVGLSNDGRARGLLVPSSEGQVRAMRAAYRESGLNPSDVSMVECHATGTTIGDAAEIASLCELFGQNTDMPLSSFKGNAGHLITAAGVAGLIKVLGAMKAKTFPPTPHVDSENPALTRSPFKVLHQAQPWTGPLRAGVSAFGFGGNNAHLIVEAYDPTARFPTESPSPKPEIAVVAIGARVANLRSTVDFTDALFAGNSQLRPDATGSLSAAAQTIEVPLKGLKFPPNDLKQSLSQQTSLLASAAEAIAQCSTLPRETTGVYVGMGCDAEIARYGARWRLAEWAARWNAPAGWMESAREAVIPALSSAGVLGTMPNIPANRLNSQFDLAGSSFAVSSEELSGVRGLNVAIHSLQSGTLDAALVGATDMSAEPVHQAAAKAVLPSYEQTAGDASVVLILKRADDARRDGDTILGLIDASVSAPERLIFGLEEGLPNLNALFGHAHAASGLLHVAAAVLCCRHRVYPAIAGGEGPVPWMSAQPREAEVRISGLLGQHEIIGVRESSDRAPVLVQGGQVQDASLFRASLFAENPYAPGPLLSLQAHRPPVSLPTLSIPLNPTHGMTMQKMDNAPALPSVFEQDDAFVPAPFSAKTPATPAQSAIAPLAVSPLAPPALVFTPGGDAFSHLAAYQTQLAQLHGRFLAQQAAVHQQFLQFNQNALATLSLAQQQGAAISPQTPLPTFLASPPISAPIAPVTLRAPATRPLPPVMKPVIVKAAPIKQTLVTRPVPPAVKPVIGKTAPVKKAGPKGYSRDTRTPFGPTFTREQLEIDASGKISTLFGPLFEQQDGYDVQVRMPEPPLLLCDRVVGLDAEAGSMGKGTIWTETDVREDSWYLNQGYMPAGVLIEAGQADLMLVSYLGIDFSNKGERAYRLLGCELTYHGHLPAAGQTLHYDIHVDGHAKHGDVRLFFFHYDCLVDDRPMLTVRQGQAGFFTLDELNESEGILWTPEENPPKEARVDAAKVECTHRSFNAEQLKTFSEGDVYGCFGPGFELGQTHNRTPKIQRGKMLFLDKITEWDPKGGAWGRGYMKAKTTIRPDDWFFNGHFKNDPCMPGTLMFEGCLQMMAFYLTSLGYTLPNDGWRFEPVPEEPIQLLCRGQVIPSSKELTYEIFIEEVHDGPYPTLWADLLCTCDGLKGFHAKRMGLRLVPDWPITSKPELLKGYVEAKPVASAGDFKFDYASLIACAWGKPSDAFGEMYSVFDDVRKVARLPGPPYHFMTRVTQTDGPIGQCKAGTEIVIEYDIPDQNEWYYAENATLAMPFCVFLEAALQPCGWLASYVGSARTTEKDLLFRNLDGTGTLLIEIPPKAGTLKTVVKITNVSISGGMIIQSFDVNCYLDDVHAYKLKTVFGFFPPEAFVNQVGLPKSDEHLRQYGCDANFDVDLTLRPEQYCGGALRLPEPMLLMIDRVNVFEPTGGKAGLGFLRAEKDVDPAEWFFKAHFFQDPVQPGSLGIEAMIQLLMFYMIHTGMADGIEQPRFESLALDLEMKWKYRGQVVPKNKLISSTIEIIETGADERGPYAICEASLWVDGKRIYESTNLGIRVVSGGPDGAPEKKPTETRERGIAASPAPSPQTADPIVTLSMDPSSDVWLTDHCPTWTLPALPMMSMVNQIAGHAQAQDNQPIIGLHDVRVKRWLPFPDGAVRLQLSATPEEDGTVATLDAWRDAANPTLSRFEPVCTGVITTGSYEPPDVEPLIPLLNAQTVDAPYASGLLFHGPSFHLLTSLQMGSNGSRSTLKATSLIPNGALNQGLLDAATHGIPHDRLSIWCDAIGEDKVGYPYRIPEAQFFGPTPSSGEVQCEVRCDGFDGAPRFPKFIIRLSHNGALWAHIVLVEVLLPKGPIGSASPADRMAFLRDGRYVEGLGLSTCGNSTSVSRWDIKGSDWLPGTVERIYKANGEQLMREVAIKDHVAAIAKVHPSEVVIERKGARLLSQPLQFFPLKVDDFGDEAVVSNKGEPGIDLAPVQKFWRSHFKMGNWPVEDLFYGLIERFVNRVHLVNPAAHAAIKGQSTLYLANHQVGIESLLFSIIASGLNEMSTVTLAKVEHQSTWLGQLIQFAFTYPKVVDPKVITYFDRTDKNSLPAIIQGLAAEMSGPGKSVLVHIEGTRSTECRTPVQKMSGAFIDMAIAVNAPIVPVRLTGGLPTAALTERLEFPVGMGKQDYWLGEPILPETLRAVGLKERKEMIINAINGLGPSFSEEEPFPPNLAFEAKAEAWAAETGCSHDYAVLFEMIRNKKRLNPHLRILLSAAESGSMRMNPSGTSRWLAELARRLFGPNGPQVEIKD